MNPVSHVIGKAVNPPHKGPRFIERETLSSATTRALREKILCGEIGEGEQLRQDALAAEYGVSRIPLREALRQLEAEGLVSFFPHRGAVVSTLSTAEIGELFEIRALIEPDILKRAIPKLTSDHLERAQELLEAARIAFKDDSNVSRWGELNWQFHSTLYAPAVRPQSMAIIEKLNVNIDRYLRIHLVLTRQTTRAIDEHRAILDACRDKQSSLATKLLKQHILDAGESLVLSLRQQRDIAAARSKSTGHK
jgi:DNA-binding GntR family transcriptional regulator